MTIKTDVLAQLPDNTTKIITPLRVRVALDYLINAIGYKEMAGVPVLADFTDKILFIRDTSTNRYYDKFSGAVRRVRDDVLFVPTIPAAGVVDTLYVQTSDNTLHRWTGTAWVAIGAETNPLAPVANTAALQALAAPKDGELRIIESELPNVVVYAFNTNAATGLTADDATAGRWNKLSSEKPHLKDPVADTTALQAILVPENGDVRQIVGDLPAITLYAFNTSATTGLTANDATPGRWNLLSGGLKPKGNLTADALTGEGIYNVQTGTVTLPAATGSQSRYIFTNDGVAGTVTDTVTFNNNTATGANVSGWTTTGTVESSASPVFAIRIPVQTVATNFNINNTSGSQMTVKTYSDTSVLMATQLIDGGNNSVFAVQADQFIECSDLNGITWGSTADIATTSSVSYTDGTTTWPSTVANEIFYFVDAAAGKWSLLKAGASSTPSQLTDVQVNDEADNANFGTVSGKQVHDVIQSEVLRGAPVADNAALTALAAKDYERRKVTASSKEYVFVLAKVPAGTDLADNAATGAWVEQVDTVPIRIFESPVADVAALKAILAPIDGQTRQVGDGSTGIVLYTFNTAATKGETANDATPGRWNITASKLFKDPVSSLLTLGAVPVPEDGETRQVGDGSSGLTFYTFNTAATEGLTANDGTPGRWQAGIEGRVYYKETPAHNNSPNFVPTASSATNSKGIHTAAGKIVIESDGIYRIQYDDGLRTNADGETWKLILNDGTNGGYNAALGYTPNDTDVLFRETLPNTAGAWSNVQYLRTLFLKSGTQIDFEGTAGVELDGIGYGQVHIEKNIGVLDAVATVDLQNSWATTTDGNYATKGLPSFEQLDREYLRKTHANSKWFASSTALKAGEIFAYPRLSDGVMSLWQVPAAWVDGTALGAAWDAAEEAKFTMLGSYPELTDLEVLDSNSNKRGIVTPKQLWDYFSDKPSQYVDMATAIGKTVHREKFLIVGVGNTSSVWFNHTTSDAVFSPYSTNFTRIFDKTEEGFHYMAVDEIITAPFPSGRPDGTIGLTDDLTHVYVSRNSTFTSDFDNTLYRDGMAVHVKSTGDTYHWDKGTSLFTKVSVADGLRGAPVANQAAIVALVPKDFELRQALDTRNIYRFRLGAVAGDFADAGATGFWERVYPPIPKKGQVNVDDGEGIYTLDPTAGTFDYTLPAATGSQERRLLVVKGVTTQNGADVGNLNMGDTTGGTINANTTERWQSFTATAGGDLKHIDFVFETLDGGTTVEYTITIRSGNHTGTVLETIVMSGQNVQAQGTYRVPSAVHPNLTNGNVYTVGVVRSGAGNTGTFGWFCTHLDIFPGYDMSDGVIANQDGRMMLNLNSSGLANLKVQAGERLGSAVDGTSVLLGGNAYVLVDSEPGVWSIAAGSMTPEDLRGAPVADNAALTALTPSEYSRRWVKGTGREYVFKLTADLTPAEAADTNNLDDDAATGKWIYQAPTTLLRGVTVADNAALTALTANEYERRLVKGTGSEYVFKLTADLSARENADVLNLADNAATGKWIYQVPPDDLRGAPVADNSALTALYAREYERRFVKGTGREYIFKLTADLTSVEDADVLNLADDAATGKWVSQPIGTTVDFDHQLGHIVHCIPDNSKSIYEINGSTYTDSKLAAFITANPITGFSVSGSDVTTPDWRGRYLGASGGRGISATSGSVLSSNNKSHGHRFSTDYRSHSGTSQSGSILGEANVNTNNSHTGWKYIDYSGGTYARPETVAMPMCIIGGRTVTFKYSLSDHSTAEQSTQTNWIDGKPIYRKTFSGGISNGGADFTAFSAGTVEHLINVEGYIVGATTGTEIPLLYSSGADEAKYWKPGDGSVHFTNTWAGDGATTLNATIYYTKP